MAAQQYEDTYKKVKLTLVDNMKKGDTYKRAAKYFMEMILVTANVCKDLPDDIRDLITAENRRKLITALQRLASIGLVPPQFLIENIERDVRERIAREKAAEGGTTFATCCQLN